MTTVEIFTDGACLGNPGPGGWAALLRHRASESEIAGGEPDTTNNRMELMAAISALETLKRPNSVILTTDSRYVIGGIGSWMPGWKKRNWKTAAGAPVKNRDLWERLDKATARHTVEWRWIKGHSGHGENERVDELARAQARLLLQ